MNMIATTNTGVKCSATGIVLVRYWIYTKFSYSRPWEGDFPNTIYLVGCSPPAAIAVYCTDEPNHMVVYKRGVCSIEPPVSDYIFSWDNKTQCAWSNGSTLCGAIRVPPDPNVIPGGKIVDPIAYLCVSFTGEEGLDGPLLAKQYDPGGKYEWDFRGFVQPNKHIVDGDCIDYTYDTVGTFGFTDGQATRGDGYWYKGPVTVYDTSGAVSFTYYMDFYNTANSNYVEIIYTASGSVAIDPESGYPNGEVALDITAYQAWRVPLYGSPTLLQECPGAAQCDDFIPDCDCGPLTVTFYPTEAGC